MEIQFTAWQDWSGSEVLFFNVSDNKGRAIASDSVTVIVEEVNDAPFVAWHQNEIWLNEDTSDNSINLNQVFYDNDIIYGDSLYFDFIPMEFFLVITNRFNRLSGCIFNLFMSKLVSTSNFTSDA